LSSIGFISDLHLAEEQPERIELFLRFLKEHTPQLEQLYILGDLFEIWLGDDLIPAGYQPVIDALKRASHSTPITVLHGNRDFLMGTQFEQLSGCKLVEEPLTIKLTAGPMLLMHGDLLCIDDQDYLKMRKKLRSYEWLASFLSKTDIERMAIAKDLRQQSKMAIKDKESEIMDANVGEVIRYMERFQVTTMVHGHTHRTAIHNHTLSTGEVATRYVLDEWHDDRGQLLIADDDGLHFESIN